MPAEPEYEPCRAEARLIRRELRASLTAAAMQRLAERTEALDRYVQALDQVTSRIERKASSLRLELAGIVDSAANAIGSARTARQAFEADERDEAFDALETLLQHLEAIRAKAEGSA